MAIERLRATANLAAELSDAYVTLVLAQARADAAAESGDFDAAAEAQLRSLRARIDRIEVEMAVIRSAVLVAA